MADPETKPAGSDKRNTVPPPFDLEEFAKEIMAEGFATPGLPDPPESEVRAVATDVAKTRPPPPTSLYPEQSFPPLPPPNKDALHIELDELLLGKDYRAALVVAEEILADDAEDIRAQAAVQRCHAALEQLYAARLGSLERVPRVVVPREEIPNLALDHRSGFVLALIDGTCTLDMILDMASMPRLDALRVLHELSQQGTIALE